MPKCITFDGGTSALNMLIGYLEKLGRALADVRQVLSEERTEHPIFIREGSKITRPRREEILLLGGYGDYVKVYRISGRSLLTQVSLKRLGEFLGRNCSCRIHHSYTVSLSHTSYIGHKRIRVREKLIPTNDSYLPALVDNPTLQK